MSTNVRGRRLLVVKSLTDLAVANFDRLMHINCLSSLLTDQRVAPEMHRVDRCRIDDIAGRDDHHLVLRAFPEEPERLCVAGVQAPEVLLLASDESSFTTAAVSPVEAGHTAR